MGCCGDQIIIDSVLMLNDDISRWETCTGRRRTIKLVVHETARWCPGLRFSIINSGSTCLSIRFIYAAGVVWGYIVASIQFGFVSWSIWPSFVGASETEVYIRMRIFGCFVRKLISLQEYCQEYYHINGVFKLFIETNLIPTINNRMWYFIFK